MLVLIPEFVYKILDKTRYALLLWQNLNYFKYSYMQIFVLFMEHFGQVFRIRMTLLVAAPAPAPPPPRGAWPARGWQWRRSSVRPPGSGAPGPRGPAAGSAPAAAWRAVIPPRPRGGGALSRPSSRRMLDCPDQQQPLHWLQVKLIQQRGASGICQRSGRLHQDLRDLRVDPVHQQQLWPRSRHLTPLRLHRPPQVLSPPVAEW